MYEFLGQLWSEYFKLEFKSWCKILSPVQENEESHWGIMFQSSPPEHSALATNEMLREILKFETKVASDDKGKLFCDYYHKTPQTWETCWKLHGHPTRLTGGRSC